MPDNDTRVLIPTTDGTVEILLLTEEDPVIGRSVACIGGTTQTANIGADYHAFVARPTGIVERLFGHGCYRLDFSGPVDAGSSWQLGVFIAHALHARRRLAQEHDAAAQVVWATGAVRPVDQSVNAVGHVAEKIALSLEELLALAAGGKSVTVIVPAANAREIPEGAVAALKDAGVRILPIDRLEQLSEIDLALPGETQRLVPAVPSARPARRRRFAARHMALGALVLAMAALSVVVYHEFAAPAQKTKPTQADELFALLQRIVPRAQSNEKRAAAFFQGPGSRAFAVAPVAQGTYLTYRWESAKMAEERVLERCQFTYGEPCLVVAINDRIRPANLANAAPKEAPRLAYAGVFDLEFVPLVRTVALKRPAVQQYKGAAGPKASALHISGNFYVTLQAPSLHAAEVQALRECNEHSERSAEHPCVLYSSGDAVVFPKRSTSPVTPE